MNWGMGALDRLRCAIQTGDGVVATGKTERAIGPQALEYPDCFFETTDTHTRRVERDASLLVLRQMVARADAKFQPSIREHVDAGRLPREQGGVPKIVVVDDAPDTQGRC